MMGFKKNVPQVVVNEQYWEPHKRMLNDVQKAIADAKACAEGIKITWQEFMTYEEKAVVDQYDKLLAEYRGMQRERNLIRNRARQRMLKSKNIPKDSSCTLSQK